MGGALFDHELHVSSIVLGTKKRLAEELHEMESMLHLEINFRGFEWLENCIAQELATIRRNKPAKIKKKKYILFIYKQNITISVLNAIKLCYARDSTIFDREFEKLVKNIFSSGGFKQREFARNRKEIYKLGELMPRFEYAQRHGIMVPFI